MDNTENNLAVYFPPHITFSFEIQGSKGVVREHRTEVDPNLTVFNFIISY